MKVLSDWQQGDPPMPGLWLIRERGVDNYSMLLRWTGRDWRYDDGMPCAWAAIANVEWCGDESQFWIVKVPK